MHALNCWAISAAQETILSAMQREPRTEKENINHSLWPQRQGARILQHGHRRPGYRAASSPTLRPCGRDPITSLSSDHFLQNTLCKLRIFFFFTSMESGQWEPCSPSILVLFSFLFWVGTWQDPRIWCSAFSRSGGWGKHLRFWSHWSAGLCFFFFYIYLFSV